VLKYSSGSKWAFADMSKGINKVDINWGKMTKNILNALQNGIALAEKLGEKLGWEEWHYKDPELERQRQEESKKYEKTTTGWGHVMGVGRGAAEGAATGAVIGSVIPGIGTGIGAIIGAIVGGVAGYAEGGSFIVDKPTLFMAGEAGRERVDVTPKSKMGSSGLGGNTHI
jgi:hypothetical protein